MEAKHAWECETVDVQWLAADLIARNKRNGKVCIFADAREVASVPFYAVYDENLPGHIVRALANARLIVAAVNACGAVNPSNPVAAAEALPELVAALDLAESLLDEAAGELADVGRERVAANSAQGALEARAALALAKGEGQCPQA